MCVFDAALALPYIIKKRNNLEVENIEKALLFVYTKKG